MTLRLYRYVEKEAFNHPYAYIADTTGLDEKTIREIFRKRAEYLAAWHHFETPCFLGIDELYLNRRYRCILTNLEERTLLDLLPGRQQEAVTMRLMGIANRDKVERSSAWTCGSPTAARSRRCCHRPASWSISSTSCAWPMKALEKIRKGLRKELTANQRRNNPQG